MREHIMELQEALALDRRRPVAFDMLGVFGRGRAPYRSAAFVGRSR
ncbi:hypothetical protein HED50_21115 [Ochrobactrum oryzae]|nr:hypothetical protein [Brucella oryzae]